MKLDINDIQNYTHTTKKGREVLIKMEIGKEYTFKELECAVPTWESLMIKHCIQQRGAAMLPSHKVGTFRISDNLLWHIDYCKQRGL